MSNELYGSFAQLGQSQAETPVSTETYVYFIGTSASGELNKAHLITSFSDYASKLGGAIGDGHNLTDAAVAAFTVGLSHVYMIPISHDVDASDSDYLGSANLYTGIHALVAQLRDAPTICNLICLPNVISQTVLNAVVGICKKAAGHWDSFMVYDMLFKAAHINEAGYAIASAIVPDKVINDEQSKAVWGSPIIGGNPVSGAAIQACLMAKSDADYDAPARCGGNLPVSGMTGLAGEIQDVEIACLVGRTDVHEDMVITPGMSSVYVEASGSALDWQEGHSYALSEPIEGIELVESVDHKVSFKNGSGSSITLESNEITVVISSEPAVIKLEEATATQLSADGVCSWNCYSGQYVTWGDHTAAFSGGSVVDERARFDNSIRMLMMVINRFQMKYRFEVDNPLSLAMRNDVIDEELTYLYTLVSKGALIGDPTVEFKEAENSIDNVAQGRFTWSIASTPTVPAKYMLAKVSYTQAGLSVYTQSE